MKHLAKKLFTLLVITGLLATGTANAIINKMRILKMKGAAQYVYCLSDRHIEQKIMEIGDSADQSNASLAKQIQDKLYAQLAAHITKQGTALKDYIRQLGTDRFVLINEDIFEYNGTNEAIRTRVQESYEIADSWALGCKGFLSYASQLFKNQNWRQKLINAECRHATADTWEDLNVLKLHYRDVLKNLQADISQSKNLPPAFKEYSQIFLDLAHDTFSDASFSSPEELRSIIGHSGLFDAKLPQLIWNNRHMKHLFLALGSGHIDLILQLLQAMGYQEILSEESLSADECTALADKHFKLDKLVKEQSQTSDPVLSAVTLDLGKIFEQCIKLQAGQQQNEAKNNAPNTSSANNFTQPIANNNAK